MHQYQMVLSGERVLVGVSGGIDSVVLLHLLHALRHKLDIELHIAHLNHQFRGDEAKRDADFVRRLAQQLKIPCTIESSNVPAVIRQQKLSPQDAARQVRYRFFDTVAERTHSHKIATAHHADDQAETVLIGLIRGVGLHGLGGIQPVLNENIIRPLLTTSRADIKAFAQAENIDFVVDSSNSSRKYLRNAVRLDVLPLLQEQFSPAIVTRLTRYAQIFQEDAFFIDKIAVRLYRKICQESPGGIQLDLELFSQQDVTIQRAVLYKAFEALTGVRHELHTGHVRSVIRLFTCQTTGKQLSLPRKTMASRSYNIGYLQKRTNRSPLKEAVSPVVLAVPGRTEFDAILIETEILTEKADEFRMRQSRDTQDVIEQGVDYDRLAGPLLVRFRLPGDRFHPLGMSGKKRVKKFFIDRKVPRNKRHIIPFFVDTQGIVWIVGYEIDERVKLSSHTTRILCCRVYQKQSTTT